MNNQVLRDDFQCSTMTQDPMIVKSAVAEKLVQEQLDLLVLQAFNLNLVSFSRDAALYALDMFSKKVRCDPSLVGKLSEVYDLLLPLCLSNRF